MSFQEGLKRLLASNFCEELKECLRSLDPSDWPSCDALNNVLCERTANIVITNGIDLQFVPQEERPKSFETGFEQRAF